MKILKKYIDPPVNIFKLIVKHEPGYFHLLMLKVILSSTLPFLHIYMPKQIIERLVSKRPYGDVLIIVFTYCAAMLIIHTINNLLKSKTDRYDVDFERKLRFDLGQTVLHLPIKDIEGAAMQDSIRLAQDSSDLVKVADIVKQISQNIITVIGVAFIIVRLNVLLFAAVVFILFCKIVFTYIEYTYNKKIRVLLTQNSREMEYTYQVCFFNAGSAKEIRVNNLQDWVLSKIRRYRSQLVNLNMKSSLRRMIIDGANIIIMGMLSFVVLKTLSGYYIDNRLTIADFTMYFTAITILVTTLLAFADLIGEYNQQLLKIIDYEKLVQKIKGQQADETFFETDQACEIDEIRFEGVYFAYPNTDIHVLKNINISIKAGEKLVIVGPNGAGKSTFIKLLCKFYKPTQGTIRLNGIDIWDIPNTEYYRFISAVFQDFSTFAFTVSEDITLQEDREDVRDVLNAVKLTEHVNKFPYGAATYISKEFSSDGVELSGGQRQKIVIARALYKNTPLLILDEPTASLDPKAESEIYTDLFHIANKKTTIFISHRMAASSIADQIAVFADGRIVEYGTHDELIDQDGVYADMYKKQSSAYVG